MNAKRVLVSGAGGFIGRWSVPVLRRRGYDVHAVLSGRGGAVAAQLAGATLHTADLFDSAALEALFAAVRPTHLLHFAWIATPGSYWTSTDNARWLETSRRMLRAFSREGGVRAVMAGSCAEYDWSQVGVCREASSPLAVNLTPPLPYVACKIALQAELDRFGREHDLSSAWGRIFLQYGPYEHPQRLVASVIRSLLMGREALCSHGRQVRAFLHVADVGAAFAALLDSELAGPVNIGAAERIAVADLIGEIARQIGRPDLVRLGARPLPPGEPPLLVPDVQRLQTELGWQPQFALHEGLADAIAWWRGGLAAPGGGAPP